MWLKDQSKEKIGWISSYGWWLPPKACSQSKYSAVRFKVSTWVLKFLNIQQQEWTTFKQLKLIKSKNMNQTGELMGLLRQISSSLLQFREQVGGEIMRIVMLPEQSLNLKLPNSDCDYCQVIERQIFFFHKYFHNCIVSLLLWNFSKYPFEMFDWQHILSNSLNCDCSWSKENCSIVPFMGYCKLK